MTWGLGLGLARYRNIYIRLGSNLVSNIFMGNINCNEGRRRRGCGVVDGLMDASPDRARILYFSCAGGGASELKSPGLLVEKFHAHRRLSSSWPAFPALQGALPLSKQMDNAEFLRHIRLHAFLGDRDEFLVRFKGSEDCRFSQLTVLL